MTSQTIRLQAAVTSSGPAPLGYVTFQDGGTTLGAETLGPDGTAVFDTALLAAGIHQLIATYQGEVVNSFLSPETFAASASAPVTVTISSVATTTTITSSSSSPTAGTVVAFTASVSSSSGAPSGGVTFYDGSSQLGTIALDNGQATLSTASLSAGSHAISASYNASAVFAGSSSAATSISVGAAAATLIPTYTLISEAPNTTGGGMALSATVVSAAGQPQGTVTFLAGGVILGTVAVNQAGVAALPALPQLNSGQLALDASFGGSATFAPSVSPALKESFPQIGPGFSLAPNTTSVHIAPLQPGVVQVGVVSLLGFQNGVDLSCVSGLPPGYTCVFSPSSIKGSGTSTLTVTAPVTAAGGLGWTWKGGLGIVVSSLVFWPLKRRRRGIGLWLLVIGCGFNALTGCGTSGTPNTSPVTILVIQAQSGSGATAMIRSAQISLVATQ
jgi:hypothetical protein